MSAMRASNLMHFQLQKLWLSGLGALVCMCGSLCMSCCACTCVMRCSHGGTCVARMVAWWCMCCIALHIWMHELTGFLHARCACSARLHQLVGDTLLPLPLQTANVINVRTAVEPAVSATRHCVLADKRQSPSCCKFNALTRRFRNVKAPCQMPTNKCDQ